MILFYQHISNNIDLFTKLINSEEYDQLIKGFESLISDKEIFEEKEIEKEEEKIEEKKEIEKIEKENIKVKKPKKALNTTKKNKKSKKNINSKIKDKKKRRKKEKKDLLELLQKEYPANPYVKKVSKTFLSRRLNKTVIYRHFFRYSEDGTFTETKLRSAGESTVYKYCKVTFKFFNDEIKNTDKIDEMLGKELKQQFAKIDNHPRTLGHLLYQPAVGQGQPDGHVVVLTAGELHGQPPLLLHEGVGGDGRAGERAEVDMVGSGVCPAGERNGLPDAGAELPVARHLQGGNLVAVALCLLSHKGSAVGGRAEGMTLFGGCIALIEDCPLALQFTVGRQRGLYADLCPGFAHLLQVDPLARCAFLDDPGLFGIEVRRQHVQVAVG